MSTLHLKKIRRLVSESSAGRNTLVMAFGRFQPPTIGHALLIKAVRHTAEKHHAHACVFVSSSQDSSKNPLSASEKVHYLSKMFPGLNFSSDPSEGKVRGIIGIFKYISRHGFDGHKINHIILVAGSDRILEFKTKLNSYNGKSYNFDSIDVVSAGERDPDDEGVAGMSGTKMRAAAKEMNFDKFRSGIPNSLSDKDTKELMLKIRTAMSVNESFRELDSVFLSEGVHDQAIFKVVFLVGGTGSGKDFILKKVLSGHGFVESNPDIALEYFMTKENLDKKMPEHEAEKRYVIRQKAKSITSKKLNLHIQNRQGLIINGTGDRPSRYLELKSRLEDIGYECKMLFVVTSDEVSKRRNIERGEMGGRMVPEHIRSEKWKETMAAKSVLEKAFGAKDFIEFDNSADLRNVKSGDVQHKVAELEHLFKQMRKFAEKKPTSPIALKWIRQERKNKIKTDEEFAELFGYGMDTLFETFLDGSATMPIINKIIETKPKNKKKMSASVPVILIKRRRKKKDR